MSDPFLSRWSRRKLEVREAERIRAEPPAEPVSPLAPPVERPPEGLPAAAPAELSPDEIAALPPVEEIDATTDLAAFLRGGVPEALRNAALRRAWSLDPAIRDRVGDALDYAYDWHVPGGVPGAGPLLPTDDPEAVIKALFSRGPQEAEAAPGEKEDVPAPDPGSQRIAAGDAVESGCRPPTRAMVEPATEASAEPPAAPDRPGEPPPFQVRRRGGAEPV